MSREISSSKRRKKRQKISEKIDNFDKNIIRIIHQFFHWNKLLTIKKIF